MEEQILLSYNENVKVVEQELKTNFLLVTLKKIGIPTIEDFELVDGDLSVDEKKLLEEILKKYQVRLDQSDGMDVYYQENLIARWEKPTYKIKRDVSEPDPKKQLYQEMTLSYFSSFEEEIDE